MAAMEKLFGGHPGLYDIFPGREDLLPLLHITVQAAGMASCIS